MTNDDRWLQKYEALKAYVDEHHHCPNKHCTLYNAQKYYRRKMKDGHFLLIKRGSWKRCLG